MTNQDRSTIANLLLVALVNAATWTGIGWLEVLVVVVVWLLLLVYATAAVAAQRAASARTDRGRLGLLFHVVYDAAVVLPLLLVGWYWTCGAYMASSLCLIVRHFRQRCPSPDIS